MLVRSTSLAASRLAAPRAACPCPRPSFSCLRRSASPAPQGLTLSTRKQSSQTRVFPFDAAWAPSIDYQSLAPTLFASSLFPYLGFLYHLQRSGQAPRLALGGFYFLLVFVFATIPAGIYAKTVYHTSLANVDWLHGSAESLLTITNLLIVLGMRQGIVAAEQQKAAQAQSSAASSSSTSGKDAAPPL